MCNKKRRAFCAATARNVYESSRPLRVLFKLFGVACWTIESSRKSTALSCTDVMLCSINTALCAYLMLYTTEPWSIVGQNTDINDDTILVRIAIGFLMRCTHLIILVTIVVGFMAHRRQNPAAILTDLYAADVQLSACGVRVPHELHWRWAGGLAIVLCGHASVLSGTGLALMCQSCGGDRVQWPWLALLSALFWFYTCLAAVNVIVLYCCCLLAIGQRLRLLNEAIESTVTTSTDEREQIRQPQQWTFVVAPAAIRHAADPEEDVPAKVRQLRGVHAILVDVTARCNRCFSRSVAALAAINVAYVLFHLYVVFDVALSEPDRPHRDEYLALSFWQNAFAMIQLLSLLHIGSRLTATRRQTGAQVLTAINRLHWRNDSEIIGELLVFGQQALQRKPRASCGFFVFEWSLAYTVSDVLT